MLKAYKIIACKKKLLISLSHQQDLKRSGRLQAVERKMNMALQMFCERFIRDITSVA